MAMGYVLRGEELQCVAEHKYAPGSYTPIDLLFYKHIWDPTLSVIPLWMAPNLITLLGTIVLCLGVLLVLGLSEFYAQVPSWAFYVLAACCFFYQTMDAVDGRQARRTGSSSPLGQLFDHGCDCLVSSLQATALAIALNLQATPLCLAFLFSAQIPFFLGQWCEHHTHVLHTNLFGVFGITEAQLAVISVFLATGWSGQGLWDELVPGGFEHLTWRWAFVLTVFANSAVIVGNFLWKSLRTAAAGNSLGRATLQLLPMAALTLAAYELRFLPRIWALGIFGLACVKCSVEIIVATVSGRKFPIFFGSHGPLLLLAVLERFRILHISDHHMHLALTYVFAAVAFGLFAFCAQVTVDISAHLGIQVFRIGNKPHLQ